MNPPRQHLLRLVSENVQRVRLIDHTFDPSKHLVVFRGNNEQGKTSYVDTLAYVMLGKAVQPPKVIRDGERHALGLLETEDLIAERVWKKKLDKTGVEVVKDEIEVRAKSKDGEETILKRPQDVLDGLTTAIAFDPLAFMDLQPAEQLRILKQLLGVDFAELDAKREAHYAARTKANGEVSSLQKRLAALPAGEGKLERIDVAALLADQAVQQGLKSARARAENQLEESRKAIARCAVSISSAAAVVKEAEAAWARANAKLKEARALAVEASAREQEAAAALEASPAPGDQAFAELATKIATASSHNERVGKLEERAVLAVELKAAESKAQGENDAIQTIDATKRETLAAKASPIPGLGLNDLGVTYQDVPLEQASGAGKIRLGVAIGFALNPKFKVIRVRHGGDLDPASQKLLEQLAIEADGLVLLECGNGKEGPGIVIEDGQIESIDGVKVTP